MLKVLEEMEKRLKTEIPTKIEASMFRFTGMSLATTRKMIDISMKEVLSRLPEKDEEITEFDEQVLFGLSE